MVRPHPAENHEVWKKITEKTDRVFVIYEGNVIEWLLAADVVIHSNCSTGVEAFLADTPVIAFRPFVSDRFETYLPNIVSKQVFSIDELLTVLKKILLSKSYGIMNMAQSFEVAEKYISALEGPLASEKIVKIIKTMNLPQQEVNLPPLQKLSRQIVNLTPLARRILLEMKNRMIGPKYSEQTHPEKTIAEIKTSIEQQKCPDLSLDDLKKSIQKFQQLLDRFISVQVTCVKPNCFLIYDHNTLK